MSSADVIVVGTGPAGLVATFKHDGAGFVVADGLGEPVAGMNALAPEPLLDPAEVRRTVETRDRQPPNGFTKDLRLAAIRDHRGARPMRTVAPHRLLDRKAGPPIAVRLRVLTRKPPGGMHGYRALEGTFLGCCLFSGRRAARTIGYVTKRGTSR